MPEGDDPDDSHSQWRELSTQWLGGELHWDPRLGWVRVAPNGYVPGVTRPTQEHSWPGYPARR